MSWEKFVKNQTQLPNDEILADLYALSRQIKQSEKSDLDYSAKSHFANHLAQLSFITSGCKLGQCSFCSYGASNKELLPSDVDFEMKKFIKEIQIRKAFGQNIDTLLFDAVGSIFDKNEFSSSCLDMLFKNINEIVKQPEIKALIFETHIKTLGDLDEQGNYNCSYAMQKLLTFKKLNPQIETFIIELGFESANPEIRNNLLFKPFDDNAYKKIIKYMKNQNINIELNVMATLPFLTQQEQIKTSAESVIQALQSQENGGYGADNVVLFPLNIRKNTFYEHTLQISKKLEKQYGTETPTWLKYQNPIWSLVATLNTLIENGHEDLLSKVSIAWYGGRGIYNDDIFPQDWEEIEEKLTQYKANLSGEKSRVNIIKSLIEYPGYKNFMEKTKNEKQTNLSYRERAEYLHNMINEHSPLLKESDINIITLTKK